MRDFPWFRCYAAEYLASEQAVTLDLEARGAEFTLECHAWCHGSIPSEVEELASLLRASPEIVKRVMSTLKSYWTPAERGRRLVNPALELERKRIQEIRAAQVAGGRKGAERRWGERDGLPMANPQNGSPIGDPRIVPCSRGSSQRASGSLSASSRQTKVTRRMRSRRLRRGRRRTSSAHRKQLAARLSHAPKLADLGASILPTNSPLGTRSGTCRRGLASVRQPSIGQQPEGRVALCASSCNRADYQARSTTTRARPVAGTRLGGKPRFEGT
jgi:hypothetical protein